MLPNATRTYTAYWLTDKTTILSNMGYAFKVCNSIPLNPAGKPNGWNEYNGEWYCVESSTTKKGWFTENGAWDYLDWTTWA